MLDHLFTLLMLILLQAVLGFDNLLYISLESKRAPEADQARVRRLGIGLAIGLRIVLLMVLINVVEWAKTKTLFGAHWEGVVVGEFTFHSVIVLIGGAFILYTATKEVMHMIALEEADAEVKPPASPNKVIAMIVIMNLVFSFDSILSAMALTDTFWVMALAIVVSGVMMIVLADTVSSFLSKNRMYEVLGLFVLFIVGVMLVTEGGHLAHLELFGNEVHAMTKTTFYFVIAVLLATDIVQSRYQKKLLAKKLAADAHLASQSAS